MSGKLSGRQGLVMDIMGRDGQERVTVAEIAAELGVSRQSMAGVMSGLYLLGLVVRERGGGTNRYRLSAYGSAVQSNRESTRRWQKMTGGSS
jgi:Mn-dependent DtxR family transcriptional regulator